ncbi:Ig-like domain-containing protein, partial [Bacillus sp. FJAT-29814]|uniref:Ig-like domain-containing protein n=1 Tax=Bacillus sp. FJAT-29814 TaxID=1729688 RepID=UPI001560A094
MGFKLKLTLVFLLIFSQLPMHSAMAKELPKWIPYGEDIGGDSSPKRIDIVGDEVYPAVFYYSDSEYIYFRMRVNENPKGPNGFGQFAWTVVFNTDTKFEGWEYMLTVNGKDERVELWKNAGEKKKGHDWNTEEDYQLWSGPASQYAKIEETETTFDNDQDYFIDWKISLSTFTDFTKIDINTPFRMFFVTSASTNNKNFFEGDIVGGEATVTLNRAPTIKELSKVKIDKNTLAEGIVEANDPDGDALNYTISAQGAHGIAEINGANEWKYSPEKDYVGEDSFTITVSDGKGGTVSAEVKIQVNEVDVEEPP